jgi:hypothetical protein
MVLPFRTKVVLALLLGIGFTMAAPGLALQGAAAQDRESASVGDPFRVQFAAMPNGNGGVRVTGYVYNDGSLAADNVQLRITEIDFSGYKVTSYIKPVLDTVPASGRAYFDVTVPDDGEAYQIAVDSWNPVQRVSD